MSTAVFEKFGTAMKEGIIQAGLAMQGMSSYMVKEVATPTSDEPITFTYTEGAKPVQTWDEFVTANERTGRLQVDTMPPLVTVKPLMDRFKEAVREVVTEAGMSHVCSPVLRVHAMGPTIGFAYIYNGEGSCIMGRILMKMGVPASEIAKHEGNGADYVVRQFFGGDRQVAEVGGLANQMQMINDSMNPWGRALALI